MGEEEECFARHLGSRAGRNSWATEGVREARGNPLVSGSASCVGGEAIHCEGTGWGGSLDKPRNASHGRREWSGDLRMVRICPGGALVGPAGRRREPVSPGLEVGAQEGQGPV